MAVHPDNRLADGPMQPVDCETCGTRVLVRKSSWEQTSLQWSEQSVAACEERRDFSPRSGPDGAVFRGCESLRKSITAAVNRGDVIVQIEEPLKTNPEAQEHAQA